MISRSLSSLKTRAVFAAVIVSALSSAAGCRVQPDTSSPSYKKGELGNGSFVFQCDDSVACDRWSNSANAFPDKVSTGAIFDVRFIANGDAAGFSVTTDRATTASGTVYDGQSSVTYTAIAPYMSSGPDGFVTVKPGYGVIAAKDANGAILDYVTVRIVKPDGLVVYDAKYKGTDPVRLEKIDLQNGESQDFRTVAEYDMEAIAGSIRVEWTSADSSIAEVVGYRHGVVTVKGKAAGKTKLTAAGAALTQEIDVEVQAEEVSR